MLVFLHQLISLTLPVCGLVLIQSCTVGLLVLCCPTCSGRRRRRSSPPSSGSWCCQRREPHRPQRCVGRPCRGCRQTWQRWRSHRAAWWLLRKAVFPPRCLRSIRERFKNTHKLVTLLKHKQFIVMQTCEMILLCMCPDWGSPTDCQIHTGLQRRCRSSRMCWTWQNYICGEALTKEQKGRQDVIFKVGVEMLLSLW